MKADSTVAANQITLSKAATGGAGAENLNLYGAKVYDLTKSQVF